MYHLALKMLLGDRAKYVMLVGGLTFAALLMTQQCAVFFGLLSWTTSHMRNMRASIWVVDPKVEQINEIKPMRDTDVNRVRSVTGVAYAVPLYTGVIQARIGDGTFKPVEMIGIDSTTLVGRPPVILSGRLENLRLPNSVMIDELAVERLSQERTASSASVIHLKSMTGKRASSESAKPTAIFSVTLTFTRPMMKHCNMHPRRGKC